MNTQVRYKLEMAARVRSFSRTHPSTQPEYAKVLGELEERLTRAETVAERQVNGTVAARAARVKRLELRRVVHSQLLRYLVAVGGVAAQGRTELAAQFRLPRAGSTKAFLTAVRGLVTRAEEQKSLLLEKGLGDTLLDDIRSQLSEMESAWEAARVGKTDHIGARAELDRITGEISGLVKVLDGINRIRFGSDPEVMVAWTAAKHVPVSRLGGEVPVPGTGVVPPVDGGIKPAA
jgi:hypothetical protein